MFLPGKPCIVDSALKFGSKTKEAMIKAEKRKGARQEYHLFLTISATFVAGATKVAPFCHFLSQFPCP
jgi:outer membrane lipopolysaccharide assembly protein LptE/RlpB